MSTGELLSSDLGKVLELLEYRFEVRETSASEESPQGKVEIFIEFEDLKRGGLEFESFVNALRSLARQHPEIEITYISDSVNKTPENSERARSFRAIQVELHNSNFFKSTLADLIVPLQFKELLEKIRGNNVGNSPHIAIDDTPEGANWRSLHIRFINGRTLLASFHSHAWNKSFGAGELGLEKKRGERPKEQWLLLEEASKNNGRISLISSKGRTKEGKRRQISELKKLLKEVFTKLSGEPFEPTGGDAYQALFVIEPEQREDNE